jgi:hypothetical protein
MASLEGFDSLDGMIAKTLKTLSEFDPGMDENEVAGFISTAFDTISANLEKGAVGNNQNFSYLDFFFGSGWRTGVNGEMLSGDALVNSMETYLGILEANKNDMFAAWKSLAESVQNGKDMFGNAMVFDADSGRTAGDL